jgi:starvation-inducible DNA-binding protein
MHDQTSVYKADLSTALRKALAETFAFYFKAHAFHWNVTGISFPSLHKLFGKIYEDAHTAVDDLAEHIRTLDQPAPFTVSEIMQGAEIEDADEGNANTPVEMVQELAEDNEEVIAALNDATTAAMKAGNAGIANFLQDRIDKHAKWGWMLRATAE